MAFVSGCADIGFLLVATSVLYDFWAANEEDQRAEMTQFLKKVGLLGAAHALLAVSGLAWPYAIGSSLV